MAGSTRLTSPNGGSVTVDSKKIDGLLSRGFKRIEEKKAPTKRSASSKSEN